MGYSGRQGDKRKMARDKETKKKGERRKESRMDCRSWKTDGA